MNEKELRALFADAVAKGGMTQAAVDAIVTDKIAKGECKADDDKDKDDDADARMDAEKMDKAAKAVADVLKAGDTKGWADPSHPDSNATSPEFRPPAERTAVSHETPFDSMNAGTIMQDLVKAALEKALTSDVITGAIQKAAEDTLYPLLKGFEADLADGIKKAMSPALKPILDRAQALVNHAKQSEALLKGMAEQQTVIGEVVQKAATKKQVKDFIEKAGKQAPAAAAPGFQRPTLANLAVVPAPGDQPQGGKGGWDVDAIFARINAEITGLTKAGAERDAGTTQRLMQLQDAALKVADTEDLATLANTLGYTLAA